ncbi:glucosidase [soil metagenome]
MRIQPAGLGIAVVMNPEQIRLDDDRSARKNWRKWGPYLSERQWGTVREDYSADGSAWDHFPHDHARSRAYRWGEDGIGGFSDDQQKICFSLAMWNGKDPILKERIFGLTGPEGNHGEDCKDLYYYLDATPTHSYLKMLYKYPQAEFPYGRLVEENRRRGKHEPEFELIDTGVFDDDKYFDVFIEYAKPDADDILMRITAHNRSTEKGTVPLSLLPQVFFRNTWSWSPDANKPAISVASPGHLVLEHHEIGTHHLYVESADEIIFCDNQTNGQRLWNSPKIGYPKDGFHDYLVHGDQNAVNPDRTGTKAGAVFKREIAPGGSTVIRLRLSAKQVASPFNDFDRTFAKRIAEADSFYADIQRDMADDDAKLVQRQAFAGMIWSKQFFYFDIPQWLNGDPNQPPPPASRKFGRNREWSHLNNADVISMPDKWEYPWYAAWDLAFHCIPLAQIDPEFAKQQLVLLTREWYMHPNGQLPAYEWQFGDVNPPVHAWATWRVYEMDRAKTGTGDLAFLERVFHKLMLNFTWWVNRKDAEGRNIFQGGFLGLDNIGVFDRSAPLPTGGFISQCDGTSWMAMYSLNLMRIALELAANNPVYQDVATKFFEHFLHIAAAMSNIGGDGTDLWDSTDEFFYDVLCIGHERRPLKVRSMVGLIPLFAVEVLDHNLLERVPEFRARLEWFLNYRPDLARLVSRWTDPGMRDTRLLSLLRGHRMKCLLKRMLDETEFLSDFGVRALSKFHDANPYIFPVNGMNLSVKYQPGESDSGLFGGNSNWRGPIWTPVNYLLIESLRRFHCYYGDDFQVECPADSGIFLSIGAVADELTRRLSRLVLRDQSTGNRAVFGETNRFQNDPNFRDLIPFHEYFHGDTGRGVGATHQTGWTGLLATLRTPTTGSRQRDQESAPAPVRRRKRDKDPAPLAASQMQ